MIQLTETLAAWDTAAFNEVFKGEVAQLEESQLPLQQALTQGSHASTRNMQVMINRVTETPQELRVRAGVFFTGILPGCACSDDVAPESEFPEFCELLFCINRQTAETSIRLLDE